ncbi:SCO family protein [Paenibacillus sp. ACRRX]|uniref:SCO family protein n=1 Tax=unclassified Paenibacillus TaxID=185978 RepID=UPI001EF3D7CE|nr:MULTISPECIES: SCO family protein [unclassified Paenibacillus]MCG7410436.1 SCO family protein [Paenibacillus sp. ACRRX]MDK8183857.1 SCO family protein [Paenibacillus sp. UMB4589-SE434]
MAQFAKRYSLQLFLCSLVLVFAVAAAWIYWPKGSDLPVVKAAPEFSMENVDGQTVSLASTNGKARLFYFFFSHCTDVCPPTTYMLNEVQDLLKEKGVFGDKANIVSVTFDPKRDTRERLMKWATDMNKADLKGWYFLRGDEAGTAEFMNKFGSAVVKDNDGNFTHTNLVTLVDQDGNVRKYYNANDLEVTPELIADDVISLTQ